MHKARLEAFSDGVIAIIITIMVLELKPLHGGHWSSLIPLIPVILSYVLSFLYLAIYWNNHHHMFYTVKRITGGVMWANLHLLFWLSLVPFVTAWMGENSFAPLTVAVYGVVLLFSAFAYWILQCTIIHSQGAGSLLKKAVRNDFKGKVSPLLYISAIGFSFTMPRVAEVIYVLVALMWIVPDRRIEKLVSNSPEV